MKNNGSNSLSRDENKAVIKPGYRLNKWVVIAILLAVFLVFGILIFDAKLFLMGDDADYIIEAYNLMFKGVFPTGRSSLYTMCLSISTFFNGTNVVAHKCFSFICAIAGFFIFLKSFQGKVENFLLYPVAIFTAINMELQVFSSSNLSEAFYMMVQYGFVASSFIVIAQTESGKVKMWSWMLLGFMGLAISLSKNIAIFAPLVPVIFFLFRKQWRNSGVALLAFLAFKIPYELCLRLFLKQNTVVGQLKQVFIKDLYHPEYGNETLGGFFVRFWDNSKEYFSEALFQLGMPLDRLRWEEYAVPTLILIAILLYSFIKSYKHNIFIFYTGLFTAVMCGASFISLLPKWGQARYIHIFMPFILLMMAFAIYVFFKERKTPNRVALNITFVAFFGIILFVNLQKTLARASESFPVFTENISGDPYYGYTTDWINYLDMGKWVVANIPADSLVAARKPNSLTVYSSGRPFYGIYNSEGAMNANQLLDKLQQEKVSYMVLASLRLNPDQYIPNQFIGTLHSWAGRIEQAYPGTIQIVHQTGTLEPCMLVKINFPKLRKELPPMVIPKQ